MRNAEREAGYALHEQQQAGESKKLDGVLKNTQDILSALPIAEDHSSRIVTPRSNRFIGPPRNPSFVGREREIREIHSRFSHEGSHLATPEGLKSVAICGLGGLGKTQVVLEYAHRHRDSYDACFWVTCDTAVKTNEGFEEIATVLGLGNAGVVENLRNVKDWLSATGKDIIELVTAEPKLTEEE